MKNLKNIIDSILKENSRKNNFASNYWYPLNYATYGSDEILSALESMFTFQTSMGSKTKSFEDGFANFLNTSGSVFCNSGSSADLLAINSTLKSPSTKLKYGDKVLVPAITWPTQVWAILQSGLEPILFDCDSENFNPDISKVPDEVLSECKAIFTTHILGTCADLEKTLEICKDYELYLLEDSCESLGAKYKGKFLGTFGIISTFSTFFSHHMTTLEGGFVVSNNQDLLVQSKILRAHGWSRGIPENEIETYLKQRNIVIDEYNKIDTRYLFLDEGYNLRPTEINAAFGIEQLKKLNTFNKTRQELSSYFYDEIIKLKNISGPKLVEGCEPCFMALPMRITNSKYSFKEAINYLETRGIESRPLIAGNLMKHPAAKQMKLKSASTNLNGADFHHEKSFYVGLTPYHTIEDIKKLLEILDDLDKEFSL